MKRQAKVDGSWWPHWREWIKARSGPLAPAKTAPGSAKHPALAALDRLELDRYHYLHSTRAELLRRLDRADEARAAYERALELVHSDPERRFLERRREELRT